MARDLRTAKKNKKDEFYTQLEDIEKELMHYKEQLKGKVIFCNCDDPYESNFFKYFASNFNHLGLKKLIATSYTKSPIIGQQLKLIDMEGLKPDGKQPIKIEINEVKDNDSSGSINLADVEYLLRHDNNIATPLEGNGDFCSEECTELLKQADIVITNPPFSLFRKYVAQLMEYKKKFLIIGNINAITYRECFKLIKENKMWLGITMDGRNKWFQVPDSYPINENAANSKIEDGKKYLFVKGCLWFTNLDNDKRHEELVLYKKYSATEYSKYNNFDGINVDKVSDIPVDYEGAVGVPITFLNKYNPDQFEIIGQGRSDMCEGMTNMTEQFVNDYYKGGGTGSYRAGNPLLGYYNKEGKAVIPYMRILIHKRKVPKDEN